MHNDLLIDISTMILAKNRLSRGLQVQYLQKKEEKIFLFILKVSKFCESTGKHSLFSIVLKCMITLY